MGPLEILLVLVVALMALGPGRLPRVARNLGKGMRAFKKATFDLTTEISRELEEEETRDSKTGDQAAKSGKLIEKTPEDKGINGTGSDNPQ